MSTRSRLWVYSLVFYFLALTRALSAFADVRCIEGKKGAVPVDTKSSLPIGMGWFSDLKACEKAIQYASDGVICVAQAKPMITMPYSLKLNRMLGVYTYPTVDQCVEGIRYASTGYVCASGPNQGNAIVVRADSNTFVGDHYFPNQRSCLLSIARKSDSQFCAATANNEVFMRWDLGRRQATAYFPSIEACFQAVSPMFGPLWAENFPASGPKADEVTGPLMEHPRALEPKSLSRKKTVLLKPGSQLKSNAVFYVTHASTKWDPNASARVGLNLHIAEALARGVPVVYLVDDFSPEQYRHYYFDYPADYAYQTSGGAHEIRATADTYYFAGGFFYFCAGETARDVALNAPQNTKLLHFVYFADALYFWGDEVTKGRGKEGSATLKDRFGDRVDSDFLDFLKDEYFAREELGLQHTTGPNRKATFAQFTFDVFRDGRQIGRFGHGPRLIQMNFIFGR